MCVCALAAAPGFYTTTREMSRRDRLVLRCCGCVVWTWWAIAPTTPNGPAYSPSEVHKAHQRSELNDKRASQMLDTHGLKRKINRLEIQVVTHTGIQGLESQINISSCAYPFTHAVYQTNSTYYIQLD
jgi:hypothetical protein